MSFARAYCRRFGHRPRQASWKIRVQPGRYDFRVTLRECERCHEKRDVVRLIRKVA